MAITAILDQNMAAHQEQHARVRGFGTMQAGSAYRPLTARRDGEHTDAHPVMGEFVSGNYFRAFGLRPNPVRLLTDRDDVPGAPVMAVMSHGAWLRDYAGDASVVGSTFWINTKPVTISGIIYRSASDRRDRHSHCPRRFE